MKDPETRNLFSKRAKRSDFQLNHMRSENQVRRYLNLYPTSRERKSFRARYSISNRKSDRISIDFSFTSLVPLHACSILKCKHGAFGELKLKKFSFLGKKQSFPILLLLSCGIQLRFRERINALLSSVSISWTLRKWYSEEGIREFNLAIHLIGNCSGMICCDLDWEDFQC